MIIDLNNRTELELEVLKAHSLPSRLVGLLGTKAPLLDTALHIEPCNSIHTFGMKYPIDVIFLDKSGCILKLIRSLKPGSVPKTFPGTASILEMAPGTIDAYQFKIGHFLLVQADHEHNPPADALRNLFHWPINLIIALFWCRFVLSVGMQALEHPHALNFGILIHNTLLMFFFLSRRKSMETSFRFFDWIIPVITLTLTMFLHPVTGALQEVNTMSLICQYIGLVGIIFSLMSLGRSFGIIPANRKIISHGAYRIVRHPLYLSEIIFYSGFFLANINMLNGVLIVLILTGQLWRSLSEERLLTTDSAYREYKQRVRYRFVPGLF